MAKSLVPEEVLLKLDRSGVAQMAYSTEMVRLADSEPAIRQAELELCGLFLLEVAGKSDLIAKIGLTRKEADNLAILAHQQGWQTEAVKKVG